MRKPRKTIATIILEQLKKDIDSGKYNAGTFLPSERQLAEELEVSKSTIHNVLLELQKKRYIAICPGKGALVVADEQPGALSRLFVRTSDFGYYGGTAGGDISFKGVFSGAEKYHTEVVVSFSDDSKITERLISLYSTRDIQAVLYFQCTDYDTLIKPLENAEIPYVITRHENEYDAVSVRVDFRETARRMVRRLTKSGHHKIGILSGPSDHFIYSEFLAGYRGAIAEEGVGLNNDWIFDNYFNDHLVEQKLLSCLEITDTRPTAFLSVRDYRAQAFYDLCKNNNYSIPNDFSIVSFDDVSWKQAELNGLTTFREPIKEMAEMGVDMLQQWVLSGEKPQSRVIVPDINERHSIKSMK